MEHIEEVVAGKSYRPKKGVVRVGKSRVGKGVFASRAIPESAVVGEITGEIIDDPDYSSEYCFDIGDGLNLEPIAPFRFINHSCEPNCEFDYLDFPDSPGEEPRKHVLLFAIEDIKKGDELTIDYNWSASDAIRCCCQAPSCRGWVVSEDYLHELTDVAET